MLRENHNNKNQCVSTTQHNDQRTAVYHCAAKCCSFATHCENNFEQSRVILWTLANKVKAAIRIYGWQKEPNCRMAHKAINIFSLEPCKGNCVQCAMQCVLLISQPSSPCQFQICGTFRISTVRCVRITSALASPWICEIYCPSTTNSIPPLRWRMSQTFCDVLILCFRAS